MNIRSTDPNFEHMPLIDEQLKVVLTTLSKNFGS